MDPEIRRSLVFLGIALVAFVINSLRTKKSSVSKDTTGFLLWQAFDSWVDLALYPTILVWLGELHGFLVMLVVTLAVNLTYVKINGSTDEDWTLMERFRNLPLVKKFVAWKLRYKSKEFEIGKILGFLFCSVKLDSFYAINFLYGKDVNFRKPRVVILFLASHVMCNIAWTTFWEIVLIPARALISNVF